MKEVTTKDTKVTKEEKNLRALPDGWAWTTIGEITLPIEKVFPQEKPNEHFTYLDISSIDNKLHKIVEPKEYLGAEAPSRARQLVHANDVLFSTVRTYLENVALVSEAYDGQIASTGFSVLRASEAVLSKLLFYYSLTNTFLEPLNELQRGTSYPAVRDGDVRVQPFPLPPLPEQERIVARLEELLSDLDAGMAALARVRAGVKRYKASVLKAAVEGKLFGNQGSGNQELGNGELPEGWRWVRFGELITEFRSGSTAVPKNEPSDYPILRSSSVRPRSVDYSDARYLSKENSQTKSNFLEYGDLLFTRLSGSVDYVANCALVRNNSANNIQYPDRIFRAKLADFGLGEFLEIWFATPIARKKLMALAKSTAGHQRVSMGAITEQIIPLPPLEEQRRIVAEVERRLESARAVESAVEVGLKRAARLRQAVLRSAFEGRLFGLQKDGK
jgi:type I restriction enzyme S subunit